METENLLVEELDPEVKELSPVTAQPFAGTFIPRPVACLLHDWSVGRDGLFQFRHSSIEPMPLVKYILCIDKVLYST